MQPWQRAAVFAAVAICVHYLALRASAGRVGDTLGALVLEGTAAFGILLAYVLGPRGTEATTMRGVGFAALSGVGISFASILLFQALRRGGPVAVTGTVVMGGGVALSAMFAPLLFGESFTGRRGIGIALGLASMIVLATEGTPAP